MSTEHFFRALRRRAPILAAAPAIVIAGLAARAVLRGLPAKLAGDALWTALVYLITLAVRPEVRPRRACAIALGVSFAVEFAQLTPYPAWISSKHMIFRLIFGTTFGVVDLAGYTIGAVIAALVHARVLARPSRDA